MFCDPTVGPDMTTETLSRFDGDERRLGRYLRERTEDGEFYFKSKFIADDLDMTPSQVGTLVDRLPGGGDGARHRAVGVHERDDVAGHAGRRGLIPAITDNRIGGRPLRTTVSEPLRRRPVGLDGSTRERGAQQRPPQFEPVGRPAVYAEHAVGGTDEGFRSGTVEPVEDRVSGVEGPRRE